MSKYCLHCGNELNNDMLICPKCGERQPKVKGTGLKISKKNMIIICAIVFVLLIVILGVPKKFSEKRDAAQCIKVVENMQRAIKTGDYELLKKVYAPAFIEEIENDFSSEQECAEAFASEVQGSLETYELQSFYKEDIDSKYETLYRYMEEKDIKQVKKIYMANIEITEGEGIFAYSSVMEVPIVKIGSRWYWAQRLW